jgi:hypothetical protein
VVVVVGLGRPWKLFAVASRICTWLCLSGLGIVCRVGPDSPMQGGTCEKVWVPGNELRGVRRVSRIHGGNAVDEGRVVVSDCYCTGMWEDAKI